jgi:uncharacterized cupin superfamily protein
MDVINALTVGPDVERPGMRMTHLARRTAAELLGATLFDCDPETSGVYHLHHANEECLVVLEGTPLLRAPTGERELSVGDVAVFRRGAEGAHAISNRSRRPARWVVLSTMNEPDVVEYPDAKVIGAIVGAAPTAGLDAPFEGFFPIEAALPYTEILKQSR